MLSRAVICLGTAGAIALAPRAVASQVPVKLSGILTAFLADSGVPTRGLPWTSGSTLPVKWETPGPVATEPQFRQAGFTLARAGKVRVKFGDRPPVEMTLQLLGTEAGLQRVFVSLHLTDFDELQKEELRPSLTADGLTLAPLKCDARTEGYGFGNLVFAVKAPGKTASGLHESWNCAHDGCDWSMSILYRRNDISPIECFSG